LKIKINWRTNNEFTKFKTCFKCHEAVKENRKRTGSGKGGLHKRAKGAQSRSGYKRKIGFEGGQMPIYRLLPREI
jgi:ribosomal protein L15